MGWYLFLLIVAAAYGCVTCKSRGSYVDSEISPEIRETGDFLLSLFDCNGEICRSYDKPEDGVTIEPQNGKQTIKPVKPTMEDWEPQYPDTPDKPEDDITIEPQNGKQTVKPVKPTTEDYEPQYPDTQHTDKPIGKPDICESIKKAAIEIESRHPDIANVQFDVIKELIRLTVQLSSMLESEDCHPAVKLLDFITLAAKRLKLDCTKLSHNCTYGKTLVPETTEIYTSSDYEEVYGESHPGVTSHDSATPPNVTTEPTTRVPWKPCTETTEIIAEDEYDDYPPFVGSIRGVPGKHYPNYKEVPITSFSCADQKYIPGFYADLETGCQVFHVCYEHRRESFLCPVGTIFNQPILACDYWYSSNCCLAPTYYEVNEETEMSKSEEIDAAVGELITTIAEGGDIKEYHKDTKLNETALDDIIKFLPVKVQVFEILPQKTVPVEKPTVQEEEMASKIFNNIVMSATHVVSKTRDVIGKIPEPAESKVEIPALKPKTTKLDISAVAKTKLALGKKANLVKMAAVPIAKVVAAKAAVPIAKVVAAKAAVPIAKVVAAKAAVPIVAAKAAVPIAKVVAAKAAVPIVAAKAAVPIAKVMAGKAAIPIVAAKAAVPIAKVMAGKAAVPIVAAKAAVPIAKVVAAKAAVPIAKVVSAKAAVPIVAKAKVAVPVIGKTIASKAAIPIAAKAKVAAAKSVVIPTKALGVKKVKVAATVPVAKAAAVKSVPLIAKAKFVAAVPKVAVKAPVLKSKILAASLPFAKSAILKSAIPISKVKIAAAPVVKAKMFKTATIPVVKGKLLALPLAKSKFAASMPLAKAKLFKAAAISPLTKKALALGYMKLLKSKKLALIG